MKPILIRRLRQYVKCRNRWIVGAIDDQLDTELWNGIIIAGNQLLAAGFASLATA
jgi:hypothetical protein